MQTTLILVFLLTIGFVFADNSEKGCGNNTADVVFVLDESGSIDEEDFEKLLDFVQDTTDLFDVHFNRTHVGVIAFASESRIIFPLGKYTDGEELKKAIRGIIQTKQKTYTDKALKSLREEMFSAQYTRPWVRHVAIVITDGKSDNKTETKKEAALVHAAGIEVFAVFVGESLTAPIKKELQTIASAPGNVYRVDNYAALESLRQTLASKACAIPSTIPPTTTTTTLAPTTTTTTLAPTTTTTTLAPTTTTTTLAPTTTTTTLAPTTTTTTLAPTTTTTTLAPTTTTTTLAPTTTTTTLAPTTTTTTLAPTTTTTTLAPTTTTTTLAPTTTTTTLAPTPSTGCGDKPADVVFVLDESYSIFTEDFAIQLDFVQKTTDLFDVHSNRTHVGVITFSEESRIIFPLGKYTEREELRKAIKGIKQEKQLTFTHLALKQLRTEMFSKQYARSWAIHVAIVITDGESSFPTETKKEARLVHEAGIQVFAIGVGRNVNRMELEAIASSPDKVYTVDNYAALESLRKTLASKACETPLPLPPTTPTKATPSPPIQVDSSPDVVFLIEESQSVQTIDFARQLIFVQKTIEIYNVQVTRIHVAVFTFSTKCRIIFHLGRFTTEGELIQAIEGINQYPKARNTHLALKSLREEITSQQYARPGVRHVAIFITNGASDNPEQTREEARLVHQTGIDVIAIGVGSDVNVTELQTIASAPDKVQTVQSYEDLESQSQNIASKTFPDLFTLPPTAIAPEPTTPSSTPIEGCGDSQADIVFVLDESGSIRLIDFARQQIFVEKIIGEFDVSFNRTQFGVITFSEKSRIIFPLGKYTEQAELKKAVEGIQQKKLETYTHLALKQLRTEMFSKQYARSWAHHVAIVITDGRSTSPEDTTKEARLVHAAGIQVFAIGVGKNVNITELEAIASSPDKVYTVDNYAALESLRKTLASKACETPLPLPPTKPAITEATTQSQETVQKPVDVVFVFGEDGSISDEEINQQLQFVQQTITNITVKFIQVHVGVITFATEFEIISELGPKTDDEAFKKAIREIQKKPEKTNPELALRFLREHVFSKQNDSSSVAHIAIVITNGNFDNLNDTEKEARLCYDAGITVIAIGIGKNVTTTQLQAIAKGSDLFYPADSKGGIQYLSDIIVSQVLQINGNGQPRDVVFVLDESHDVHGSDFDNQLIFVQTIIDDFGAKLNLVHVGVITFAKETRIIFEVGKYMEKEELKQAVRVIQQQPKQTNTHTALQVLREDMFSDQHARTSVAHVAIFVTNGKSSNPDRTKEEAHQCHVAGIQIIAIGVGEEVTMSELQTIASEPEKVHNLKTYTELEYLPPIIKLEVHQTPTLPLPPTATTTSVTEATHLLQETEQKPVDVVFVLGEQFEDRSISDEDINQQFSFVQQTVKNITTKFTQVHVGVITYSTAFEIIFELGQKTDEKEFKKAIREIQDKPEKTNPHLALKQLREHMFSKKNDSSSTVHIAIVITKGNFDDIEETANEARLCDEAGITVIAIGIGKNVTTTQLKTITSVSGLFYTPDSNGGILYLRDIIVSLVLQIKGNSKQRDVVFVLDESHGISPSDFSDQRTFVDEIIEHFGDQFNLVHVGVITFAKETRIIFEVGKHTDINKLIYAVIGIQQKPQQTNTHTALQVLREDMFSDRYARTSVAHVAIFITNGNSSYPERTEEEARRCHVAGIQIIAIGVGEKVTRTELQTIASEPEKVHNLKTYTELENLPPIIKLEVHPIPSTLAPTTPTKTLPPTPTTTTLPPITPTKTLAPTATTAAAGPTPLIKGCAGRKLTDQIWSISDQASVEETNLAIDFINIITQDMAIAPNRIQVGLVQRFCDQGNGIQLKDQVDGKGFRVALGKRRLTGNHIVQSVTAIGGQLYVNGRTDAVKYGILIVDYRLENLEQALDVAQRAKKDGIRLIVIGVGDRVQQDQLRQLSSPGKNYFYARSYSELAGLKSQLIQTLCKGITEIKYIIKSLRDYIEQF